MANQQQPAWQVAQGRFEPCDGVQIEVVGWLVQHQQIGFGQQQARQRNPDAPPTRKLVCIAVRIFGGKPEPG